MKVYKRNSVPVVVVQIKPVLNGKPLKGSRTITIHDATVDEVKAVIDHALDKVASR